MAYPNPNSGTFYLTKKIETLAVVDITGRNIEFNKSMDGNLQKIELPNTSGIYILRVFEGGKWNAQKIMVQQP